MSESAKAQREDAKSNNHEAPSIKEEGERKPATDYDFKHPARVSRSQLRTLENLHDNLARLLSSTLSGAMRGVVDVDTAFVDQTTYAEFIMSLSNPSCSYQFALGPTRGLAILDFPLPLVFALVDRTFGGKGSSEGVEGRTMTPIEVGVTHRSAKRVIGDLEATWAPIQKVKITDIELETNPEFLQITAPSEIVILIAFEVNSAHISKQLVKMCYPFFTLEPILPLLGEQHYVRGPRLNREATTRRNRSVLGPAKMPLVVEMGRTDLALEDVDGMRVGDVVCMRGHKTDPCIVFVGGEPKLYARPFANEAGEIKLQVVGKVPQELKADYPLEGQ